MTLASARRWPEVPLGTLAELRNGVNYTRENFGTGVKVINVRDFQNHTYATYDALDQINPEGAVADRDLLRHGDVLFVRSNGNRDLIGRSLFIRNPGTGVTHSAFTIRARFTSPQAVPSFYAYMFRSQLVRRALSARGGGTNISNLNQRILNDLPVPLPSIQEQSKIAAILSAYDDLIQNNLRRIRILAEMAQAIYREWFVNFRFPAHEKVKMVDSSLGKIPEGWKLSQVVDIAELRRDRFREAEHDALPLLDLSRIPRRSLAVSEFGRAAELTTSRIVFEIGDVLFGSIRPYLHKVVYASCRGVTNTSVFVIRRRSSIPGSFLLCVLFSEASVAWADQHSGGTKMPVVKWDVLRTMPVVLPPTALLEAFDRLVSTMLQSVTVMTLSNLNLRETRDLLLPRLVSGKLDVSDLDLAMPEVAA